MKVIIIINNFINNFNIKIIKRLLIFINIKKIKNKIYIKTIIIRKLNNIK
jgi:hypothetical protein